MGENNKLLSFDAVFVVCGMFTVFITPNFSSYWMAWNADTQHSRLIKAFYFRKDESSKEVNDSIGVAVV